jgi:hypothetical protein
MSILGTQPNHTMLDPNGAMVGAKPGHMRLFGVRRSNVALRSRKYVPNRTGGNNYSRKTQLLYIPASAPERECDMIA